MKVRINSSVTRINCSKDLLVYLGTKCASNNKLCGCMISWQSLIVRNNYDGYYLAYEVKSLNLSTTYYNWYFRYVVLNSIKD